LTLGDPLHDGRPELLDKSASNAGDGVANGFAIDDCGNEGQRIRGSADPA